MARNPAKIEATGPSDPGADALEGIDRVGAGGAGSDIVTAEVEKGFGTVTLELEVPYERDTAGGAVTTGAAGAGAAGTGKFVSTPSQGSPAVGTWVIVPQTTGLATGV